MPLQGKHILLIITGGIAAYKTNMLVRDFVKKGAQVRIVATPSSAQFVSFATLATLSGNEVLSEFWTNHQTWNNHVDLALWADLILIAPCTANTLGKLTHGLCDNLATAVYMSAKCPVFIAPAMDLDMYAHPTTKQNLEKAQAFGHTIIPAEFGALASGLEGQGRMAEPETIARMISEHFQTSQVSNFWKNKKVLITAGPTYEAIDPVRFIGNYSSGKMGYAIAEEAAQRGAEVILISGPSSLSIRHSNITLRRVVSAKEMHDEVFQHYASAQIAIASAAVADYAPKTIAKEKIKKNENKLVIELVKNPDILKAMGDQKKDHFLVGFALETQNEEENAKDKLKRKNLDLIVLNSLRDPGAGFQNSTNKIKIISPDQTLDFPLKSKTDVAKDLLDTIEAKASK